MRLWLEGGPRPAVAPTDLVLLSFLQRSAPSPPQFVTAALGVPLGPVGSRTGVMFVLGGKSGGQGGHEPCGHPVGVAPATADPTPGGLQRHEFVLATVLEARAQSRVGPAGLVPSGGSGPNLGLSQLLLVRVGLGLPWLVAPSLLSLPRWSHGCPPSVCLCSNVPLLMRTPFTGAGPALSPRQHRLRP